MCGICGIHGAGAVDRADPRLAGMLRLIVHRGPDADGTLAAAGVSLGMRRLSIIDLAGGDQPIYGEDGAVGVVFNGEIYNFADLRTELERLGHEFRTRSDTEVLVHGYEQWGEQMMPRLRGMFAFAIWDGRARRLLIARDRFGKKPLYFARRPDELLFGSEIKSLLSAGVSADIDDDGLADYLALRYVPAPRTMFRHVRQLPPGHAMSVGDDGERIWRWWRLAYGPKLHVSREEAVAETERLMRDAVERRLVSDVPLGCFLSGGLDSSTVLSFMADAGDQPVRTFSIGFDPGWSSDELPHARAAAEAFGARHHEVRMGAAEFLELLPVAVWHRDEPLAEPSEIPLLRLSRLAREHVKVVLSGEGGDELLGGYPKYRVDRPLALAGRAARALARDGRLERLAGWDRLPRRARLAVGVMAEPREDRRLAAWFGADRAAPLSGAADGPLAERLASLPPGLDPLDRMLALDVESYLIDNLLIRGDKMTMAASVEGRMPLLDHVYAEYVARLPVGLKVDARRTKIVMRAIAGARLPASLLARKKVGFAVPVSSWFRGELGVVAERLLLGPQARRRRLVPVEDVRAVLGRHRAGRYDLGKELWSLVNLEVWARIFLDGVDPAAIDLTAAA